MFPIDSIIKLMNITKSITDSSKNAPRSLGVSLFLPRVTIARMLFSLECKGSCNFSNNSFQVDQNF